LISSQYSVAFLFTQGLVVAFGIWSLLSRETNEPIILQIQSFVVTFVLDIIIVAVGWNSGKQKYYITKN
jgi:hypothetical protein